MFFNHKEPHKVLKVVVIFIKNLTASLRNSASMGLARKSPKISDPGLSFSPTLHPTKKHYLCNTFTPWAIRHMSYNKRI